MTDKIPARIPATVQAMNGKPLEGEVMQPDVNQITEYDLTALRRFVEAFHNGYNISEACQYVGVSRTTYYDWLEKYPQFKLKVEEAKNMPNRVAKEQVIKAINNGDANLAFRWLERRDPDFKAKGEVDVNHGLQQTKDKIKGFLDDTDDLDAAPANADSTQPSATAAGESADDVAQPTPPVS